VSSRVRRCNVAGVILRIIVGTSVVMSSGCAYFHPAFMTNASRVSGTKSIQGQGVLVCERYSLRRSACTVMPRSDLEQMLNEQRNLDPLR
jgi:hypothetical protein